MKRLANTYSVLVVSSAMGSWGSAINALESLGYRVETAEGGVIALSMLDHKKADLLIIDNTLTDLDASEVIRIIRYAYPKSKLPVILVIQSRYGGHHAKINNTEVNAIVLKPDIEPLMKRVVALLDQKSALPNSTVNQKTSPWTHVEKLLLMNKRLKRELQQSKRVTKRLRQNVEKHQAIEPAPKVNHGTSRSSNNKLTGLIERTEFELRLKRAITTAQQTGGEHTLCYLQLNDLHKFVDRLGRTGGNDLLRQVAQLLQSQARKRDTVAHLGNGEFAILMEHCSVDQASRLASILRESPQKNQFVWQEKAVHVDFCVGVVPIKGEHSGCADILDEAKKAAGRTNSQETKFIDGHASDKPLQTVTKTRASQSFENVIANGRLHLYYQPIESLQRDANGDRYELFVRMQDQFGRFVRPGAFLPAAERFDLITNLDQWVISTALAWLARNSTQLNRLALCCINLSVRSLSEEKQHEFIAKQFSKTRIPPQKICFEISETAAITDVNTASQWMSNLGKLGCSFALDDFGSGLSSFAYLQNLPAEYIKIDGKLVKNLLTNPFDLAMVRSINEIAHVMGKKTIAEMVEDDNVVNKLREIGVDYVQGYAIARPLPIKALILESLATTTAK